MTTESWLIDKSALVWLSSCPDADKDFDIIAEVTGQSMQRLAVD